MTIRGKQRPPLASQSIAKAFWVILAHTYTQTQRYTHRKQEDTPQGHINHTHTYTHKNEGRISFIPCRCLLLDILSCSVPSTFLSPNFCLHAFFIGLILPLLFTFFHFSLSLSLSFTPLVSLRGKVAVGCS